MGRGASGALICSIRPDRGTRQREAHRKYVVIGIAVVIALLAWVLSRRGASGLGQHGSTDTEAGTSGQGHIGASRGGSDGGV